ncbi:hypothetical protein IPH92_05395 [Candidatus Kaiserbacteria bacterium]|nr:MAG: hypothetical protein IPH92_05395 [Candidatus Kaiserbacteria bacterium]
MEVLVLDGKSYVKASKAAKELGYATDYVGQLCRGGQVDAHLIGRTWYVNQEHLSTHKVEKKRTSKAKAREYAKRTIEEHRKHNAETTNHYTNIAIRYEHDDESLLPETKKIPVASAPVQRSLREVEKSDDLSFENKGKTVSMSGTLNVIDVTDGPTDEDTVVLHPSRIRPSVSENDESEMRNKKLEQKVLPRVVIAPIIERKTFTEKLLESNVSVDPAKVAPATAEATQNVPLESKVSRVEEQRPQISVLACVAIVLVVLLTSLATLPLGKRMTYTPLDGGIIGTEVSYTFSISTAISIISSKI